MGAWGTGIFDNDAAADWASDLAEQGSSAVLAALQGARAVDYLDADVANTALAAADTVARLHAGGGERTAYAEAVTDWTAANADLDIDEWLPLARTVVVRIVDVESSELFELWRESDELSDWLGVINELMDRLQ